MKYFGLLLIVAGGLLAYQPQIIFEIPLPQNQQWEDKFISFYIKKCPEKIPQLIEANVTDKGGLTPDQFQALLINPNFQQAFCECQGDIIRHERMIPSGYLPSSLTKPQVRKLASTMSSHLDSPAGHKQINYCYVHAWTKASFAN